MNDQQMNDQLSPSELLCAFLDNELDATETSTLFYMLAQNPEMQGEMRQLVALRSAMTQPLAHPPAHLRQRILQTTGLAAESAPPPAPPIPLWRRLIAGRPFLMLLSGVLASVLTMLLVAPEERAQEPAQHSQEEIARESMVRGAMRNEDGSAHRAADGTVAEAPLAAGEASHPRNPGKRGGAPHHLSQYDVTRFAPAQTHEVQVTPLQSSMASAEREHSSRASEQSSAASDTIGEHGAATSAELLSTSRLRAVSVPPQERPSPALLLTPPLPPGEEAPELSDPGRMFSFRVRAFSARSTPDLDIPPLSDPPLNNFAAGIFYALGENQLIGAEIGQENFLQQYDGFEGEEEFAVAVKYRQNYLALWGGVAYQYMMDPITSGTELRPFARVLAGGLATGPMGRGMAGIELSTGPVALTLGAEYTVALYRFQERWFSSSKFGITYGAAIQF